MPVLDIADVSPADFGRTRELIDWGYRSARRSMGAATSESAPARAKRQMRLDPQAA